MSMIFSSQAVRYGRFRVYGVTRTSHIVWLRRAGVQVTASLANNAVFASNASGWDGRVGAQAFCSLCVSPPCFAKLCSFSVFALVKMARCAFVLASRVFCLRLLFGLSNFSSELCLCFERSRWAFFG